MKLHFKYYFTIFLKYQSILNLRDNLLTLQRIHDTSLKYKKLQLIFFFSYLPSKQPNIFSISQMIFKAFSLLQCTYSVISLLFP